MVGWRPESDDTEWHLEVNPSLTQFSRGSHESQDRENDHHLTLKLVLAMLVGPHSTHSIDTGEIGKNLY